MLQLGISPIIKQPLSMQCRCTPKRIFIYHFFDDSLNFYICERSSCFLGFGFPIQFKTLSVPSYYSLRLHNDQYIIPVSRKFNLYIKIMRKNVKNIVSIMFDGSIKHHQNCQWFQIRQINARDNSTHINIRKIQPKRKEKMEKTFKY